MAEKQNNEAIQNEKEDKESQNKVWETPDTNTNLGNENIFPIFLKLTSWIGVILLVIWRIGNYFEKRKEDNDNTKKFFYSSFWWWTVLIIWIVTLLIIFIIALIDKNYWYTTLWKLWITWFIIIYLLSSFDLNEEKNKFNRYFGSKDIEYSSLKDKKNIYLLLKNALFLIEKNKAKLILNSWSIIFLIFIMLDIIYLFFYNYNLNFKNILISLILFLFSMILWLVIYTIVNIYTWSGPKQNIFLTLSSLTTIIWLTWSFMYIQNKINDHVKNVNISSSSTLIKIDNLKLQYPSSTWFLDKNYVNILNSNYVSLKILQSILLRSFIVILFLYIITYLLKDIYRNSKEINRLANKLQDFILLINSYYTYWCKNWEKWEKALKKLDRLIWELLVVNYIDRDSPGKVMDLLPKISEDKENIIDDKIIKNLDSKLDNINDLLAEKMYK